MAGMQVVIVAGGLGTRLGRLTLDRPKALLPVAGCPFLQWVLRELERQGRRRVHLCLGVHADQVHRYLRLRPASGLEVTTSTEEVPLGTAGCLRHAFPSLDERFVVMFGDTYFSVDLDEIELADRRAGRLALMVVYRNNDRLAPSNVRHGDGLVLQYDKVAPPGTFEHIDYGVAVFGKQALANVAEGRPTDLTEVVAELISRSQLAAHEVHSRFYEIGSVEGYLEFKQLVEAGGLAMAGAV